MKTLRLFYPPALFLVLLTAHTATFAADVSARVFTPEEISACARGASTVSRSEMGVRLFRLPASTIAYLEKKNPTWGRRAHCTAGITLDFISDSATLAVDAVFVPGINAQGPIDIRVNGEPAGRLLPEAKTHRLQAQVDLPLPGKPRRITLFLPQSCGAVLRRIALAPGSTLSPAPRQPVWLAIGDSITQGTGSPSEGYAQRTALALGLTLHNAGIGGHRFDVGSLTERFEENPVLITIAFGTNDWNSGAAPDLARGYLTRLRELWPKTPVVVLEPIFRTGRDADATPPRQNSSGLTLPEYRRQLAAIARSFPGVTVLPTEALFPRDASLLADGVHPNDRGNAAFAQRLTPLLAAAIR